MSTSCSAEAETTVDLGALIDLVRSFPHLYDKQSKSFSDKLMRENSWHEISLVLGVEETECQRLWKNLRDRYGREKKKYVPSGAAAPDLPTWQYFNSMRFLENHIKSRKTHSNIKETSAAVEKQTITNSINKVWDSLNTIVSEDEEEVHVPYSSGHEDVTSDSMPSTSFTFNESATLIKETAKKRSSGGDIRELAETAKIIKTHLEQRSQPSSTELFGQYVAQRLAEFNEEKRKSLKKEIVFLLEQ